MQILGKRFKYEGSPNPINYRSIKMRLNKVKTTYLNKSMTWKKTSSLFALLIFVNFCNEIKIAYLAKS